MNKRWYYLGLLVIIIALVFRLPLLLIAGIFLLLLIGLIDLWATFGLRDLHYQRQFSEQRVFFGEEITFSLSIENAKLLPLPWLEIEDTLPGSLTLSGRQVRTSLRSTSTVLENLFSPGWYERVTRRYTLICKSRGVHKFGPTVLRSGDVFGFTNQEKSLDNWQYILVYPLIAPLSSFNLPSRHPFGDRRAPRRLLEDPSRVIGIRDYTYGDSLRRVHWKATARTLHLQSKVYEATTTYTLVLFLNVAANLEAWQSSSPEIQELAISATASVADWAISQGFATGLYANTTMFMPEEEFSLSAVQKMEEKELGAALHSLIQRRRIQLPPASSEEQRKRIMEALARIQPYFGSSFEELLSAERTQLPTGATVVVVTSTVSDTLLDSLVRIRQAGHAVTLLFVGNTPLPIRIPGLTVYHLGGTQLWQELVAAHTNGMESSSVGFQL